MENVVICQSSPKAEEYALKFVAEKEKQEKPKVKQNVIYPFDDLEVGQSFTLPLDGCNWKSLRISTYHKNARDRSKEGRHFAFFKHEEINLCEVARIA